MAWLHLHFYNSPFTFGMWGTMIPDLSSPSSVGPSLDPSGVSLVDCIKVYGKARDVFGWPEHPPPPLPSTKVLSHEAEEDDSPEVMPLTSAKPLSPADRLVCNALSVLGNHFISVDQSKVEYTAVVMTTIFGIPLWWTSLGVLVIVVSFYLV